MPETPEARLADSVGFEPHRATLAAAFGRLGSSPDGLGAAEAATRLEHEGRNVLPEPRRPSLWRRAGRHLGHRFALLLWAGAALALVAERFSPGEGMALIAAALGCVVLVNAAFSFYQEGRVEHAMGAFRKLLSRRARVLRDGRESEIDAAEVVAGDVLLLREGDRVAADARLFEAHALRVDNAPLTGESEPQLRTVALAAGTRIESRNLVFSGTLVTSGTGKAVVYATGSATEFGHIAAVTLGTRRADTPISRELHHFVRVISAIAVGLGVFFFAAGSAMGNPFWTNLVFAIGIIVANVPEGLLPTVTLGLAIAGRKMAKRNALLKTLESAETLGCTTVICSDKTGTLTRNEMHVTDVTGATLAPLGGEALETALRVMVLCNNAVFDGGAASGDPTETALLLHAECASPGCVGRLRAQHARAYERPFDSTTREMATVNHVGAGLQALLKGAPEEVVAHCTAEHGTAPWSAERRTEILANADALARSGKRVLALATKPVDSEADLERESLAGGYVFAGLVAMHDPPRAEVRSAIARCLAAGIHVVIVSGDHPLTVQAIARAVGIPDSGKVRTGAELAGLGKAALRSLLSRNGGLFARTSPLDKLRIVTALQEMGHVVAVTGDGVNDAPALKRADIGIAMGLTGTDVAREAADMVLMDDDFATIVAAVEEGRVIYANIRRFAGYVLTSNVPELLPYVAFVLLGIPLPLPVLLILAIDLGTDMVPAIALASETAESDLMAVPPRPRSQRLMSRQLLLSSYALFGLFEASAGFAAYFAVLLGSGFRLGDSLPATDPVYGQAIAAYFAAIVICQIANVLVWRTTHQSVFAKGLFRNRAVLAGILIELLLLLLIVELPAGHAFFGTRSLPAGSWLIPIPFALAMLALAELWKAHARRSGSTLPQLSTSTPRT